MITSANPHRPRNTGLILAGFLAVALLSPGCSTVSPTTEARLSILASTAAYIGTAKRLQAHPEDRVKFELASQALASLAAREDYDPAKFAAIVASLPVVLRGDNAVLYTSAAVMLWENALQSATPIDRAPLVKATLNAVRQGMDRALAGP